MGIVFPSAAIARRWDGALQARLRRVPLEEFLRARATPPAPAGVSQDSDNVARAAGLIVDSGLKVAFPERAAVLPSPQRILVAQMACLVSQALAELISQPNAWRTAALVSTARLLSPWIGLNAAAMESASHTRRFQSERSGKRSPTDLWIGRTASAAVTDGDVATMTELSAGIARRLGGSVGRNPGKTHVSPPIM